MYLFFFFGNMVNTSNREIYDAVYINSRINIGKDIVQLRIRVGAILSFSLEWYSSLYEEIIS